MSNHEFIPHHINASASDFTGNGGLGRYIFLPGSDGRAEEISRMFKNVKVLKSSRAHNVYLGTLEGLDVASVSSGMGCPSLDIIVNELIQLGASRFLRVGTAGSLQPSHIRAGHLVVATASVRDEHTSRNYVPIEFPATASLPMIFASHEASSGFACPVHFGTVHSKDSLYAREFLAGPLKKENEGYMQILKQSGVLASEMESSHLFVLASLYNHQMQNLGKSGILAGCILGVIGDDEPFGAEDKKKFAIEKSIEFAVLTFQTLASKEIFC